jgi:hypothetical protein
MSVTKERVRTKTQEAIDPMKHHPLTPKMAIELFTSILRSVSILNSFGAVDVGRIAGSWEDVDTGV